MFCLTLNSLLQCLYVVYVKVREHLAWLGLSAEVHSSRCAHSLRSLNREDTDKFNYYMYYEGGMLTINTARSHS